MAHPRHADPDAPYRFNLLAGVLALDFTNTSSGRGGPQHIEHLRDAADILRFVVSANVLPEPAAAEIGARLAQEPAQAAALLSRALALREALYDVGYASAHQHPVPPEALRVLAAESAATLPEAALVADGDRIVWSWGNTRSSVAAILGPICHSAVALLGQGEAHRIRQCPGQHCGFLFHDRTKNRSRRWCEMEICGNRAKQRERWARVRGPLSQDQVTSPGG